MANNDIGTVIIAGGILYLAYVLSKKGGALDKLRNVSSPGFSENVLRKEASTLTPNATLYRVVDEDTGAIRTYKDYGNKFDLTTLKGLANSATNFLFNSGPLKVSKDPLTPF